MRFKANKPFDPHVCAVARCEQISDVLYAAHLVPAAESKVNVPFCQDHLVRRCEEQERARRDPIMELRLKSWEPRDAWKPCMYCRNVIDERTGEATSISEGQLPPGAILSHGICNGCEPRSYK